MSKVVHKNFRNIKERFFDYYKNLKFTCKGSYSITLSDNKDLLFVNSGMVPFKEYLSTFDEINDDKRIVNSQLCLRLCGKHNDIEDIGFSDHHLTSFEMLGNFIFEPFDILEILKSALFFLIKECNFDKQFIHVTCHPDSKEIFSAWNKLLPKELIFIDINNEWSCGNNGPSGLCTEIYYKGIELWNLVFVDKIINDGEIVYKKFTMLDAGMGFERLLCFIEDKNSIFDTSMYSQFLNCLLFIDNKKLNVENKEVIYHKRIIVDHLKTSFAIFMHNIMPSNKLEGYIIRKLLRRCLRSCKLLGINNLNLFINLINNICEYYQSLFFNINFNKFHAFKFIEILEKENELMDNCYKKLYKFFINKKIVSNKEINYLYNTLGIYKDITMEFIKVNNIKIID